MKNKSTKERKNMTKFRNKIAYVVINSNDLNSIKKAEVKKTKLENQGYKLINNRTDLLIYRNENYLNKKSTSLGA
jgi:formylmethanofuran dehydrogenase subunit D